MMGGLWMVSCTRVLHCLEFLLVVVVGTWVMRESDGMEIGGD
jgi:hypothetical protein